MTPLIDTDYLHQNADAMRYVKFSVGAPAFYSTYEPIPHGKEALEALEQALLEATNEIFLVTWYLEPDMELYRKDWDQPVSARNAHVLENILIGKAREGVIVRGIVWNFLNLKVTQAPFDYMVPSEIKVPLDVVGKIFMRRIQKLNATLHKINRLNKIVIANHPLPFATSAAFGISFPLGGAHHQKIWIMRSEENLTAFVGGMNLRQHDWDSAMHGILDQRRNPADMEGTERKRRESVKQDPEHPPRHDWMTKMEGQAAYRLLEEFKKRWSMAREGNLPIMTCDKVPIAGKLFVQKCHTYPVAYGGGNFEILMAYEYAFRQARSYIYIENQYWTCEYLTKVLMEQLAKNTDLHVVMVLPDKAEDPVIGKYIAGEQWFLLRQLWSVSGKSRVRAYTMYKKHPVNHTYINIYIHAKIAIVDDLWMTIGSANTNNRSMLLDTECNVQVAQRDIVKAVRKKAWREMLGKGAGASEDAVLGIKTGWIPQGERNEALMKEGKELEGYIVPLKPPDKIMRLPEEIRLLI